MLALEKCLMTKNCRSFASDLKRGAASLWSIKAKTISKQPTHLRLVESALPSLVKTAPRGAQWCYPEEQSMTPELQKIQELEASVDRLEREKSILKKLSLSCCRTS